MSVTEIQKETSLSEEVSSSKSDWWDTAGRVGSIALPFLKMNNDVDNVCSVVKNSLKSREALFVAMDLSFVEPKLYYCLFEVSLALGKVTATVLGSVILETVVTGIDVVMVGVHVAQDLWVADFSAVFEDLFYGVGDVLWLAILLTGSMEFLIGLYLYMAATSLNTARKEWDAGRMPEVAAKLLMVGIRLNQAESRAKKI